MKESPILFSAPMVRALLDGSKTQTRRIVKKDIYLSRTNPPHFRDTKIGDVFVCPDLLPTSDKQEFVLAECTGLGTYHCMGQKAFVRKHCPYGTPGDRLWVKEGTIVHRSIREQLVGYKADGCTVTEHWEKAVSPIHMRRVHARILLEITEVRVQRLQDISEEDALAEGVTLIPPEEAMRKWGVLHDPRMAFAHLWKCIHGADAWDANPWLWCLTFRRIAQ